MEKLMRIRYNSLSELESVNQQLQEGWTVKMISHVSNGDDFGGVYIVLEK